MKDKDEISYTVHSTEDSKGWALGVENENSAMSLEEFVEAVRDWVKSIEKKEIH